MRSYKKLLSVVLSLSLILTACGTKTDDTSSGSAASTAAASSAASQSSPGQDSSEQSLSDQSTAAQDTTAAETTAAVPREHATSSMLLSLEDDGTLNIQRPTLIDKSSKVNDGTWTIFVYICGSNLESEVWMATSDMQGMLDASTDENIKFVVQTGGSTEWHNGMSDPSRLDRFVIYGGDITLVDNQPCADMGSSETLSDFLKWGISEYPAQNMGLILWNHGGGSISGVCFDDLYDGNSLTLRDIDQALLSINDMMTYNFEFIGFDACLMNTLESANILASHAYYMYASQEVSYGFDYKAIGEYLKKHPTADGAELGRVVADSYYEMCEDYGFEDSVTMSVIDLSRIDELVTSFNAFTSQLYSACYNESGTMTGMVRNVLKADNFGGNNDAVGYTNMVDLDGFIDAGRPYAEGADAVKSALQSAVVYAKNGPSHPQASGLSLYYPLEIQGSTELKTFSQIAVSPFYLALVDIIAYGAAHAGDISAYDDTQLLELWGNYSYGSEEATNYWDYYSDVEKTGASPLITFSSAPQISSDGIYGFTLSPEGLENTAAVQAFVYMFSDDMADILFLGISADVIADWTTGHVEDNFDGYWFSLPDGQNLAAYIMNDGKESGTYVSPVDINGETTNIVFTHDYEKGTITINGIWDGIDENGMSDKGYRQLKAGDKITPQYVSFSTEEGGDDGLYEGTTYTYTDGAQLGFNLLSDGEYLYAFSINDIYGDYLTTDVVNFSMLDGKAYYNDEW